jgi:CUB/sushi domain-containing protein
MQSPVKFLLILSILTLSVHSDEGNDEENYSADVKRSGFIYRYQHNNRRCVNPGVPGNGYSYFQSTNVGAIVIHKCKPGFALVGSKIRVCLSNGRWNLNIPNCVAFGSTSGCERPGSLENGIVLITSTHVNSIVKYKCRDGFKLVGSSYQVCRANGRWTGTFPKCIASGCPKLSNPPNGQVKVTSNRIGAVATYSCNSGFNLAGNINRVCRPDGSWSGSVPTCQGDQDITFI